MRGSRAKSGAAGAAFAALFAAAFLLTGPAHAQQKVPKGVTPEKIAQGEKLYAESGCAVCHGKEAKGVPGMTADLTDGKWGFIKEGSYGALAEVITKGLTAEETGGMPFPPRGGKNLTDDQIAALAAYVWKLNQEGE